MIPIRNFRSIRAGRGNVMVIAMLILGAGTLGLAAWTSLVIARSTVVDATEAAMDRRVRLENSRQAGREWVYTKMIRQESGPAVSEEISSGWGHIDAPAFAVSYLGTTTKAPYNRTSPMARGAYGASIDVAISDGVAASTGRFFINSIHPSLAGDLLAIHEAPSGYSSPPVTGDLRVKGRSLLLNSRTDHSFKTQKVNLPLALSSAPTISDLSGNTLLPQNFPFAPLTTGLEPSGAGGGSRALSGQLNVVNNPNNTANSLYHKVVGGDHTVVDGLLVQPDPSAAVYVPGDGSVEINLASSNLENTIISQNVSHVLFRGQVTATEKSDAGALDPVTILVLDPMVTMISFIEENYRPMVFGIKGSSYPVVIPAEFTSTVGFPKWRMVMEVENVLFEMNVLGSASQLNIVGGIRTNAGFKVVSGSPTVFLEEDTAPGSLGASLTRHGWVESFVQPGT